MTYSQEQAKHRVSIKRQLRQLGYTNFNNEDTTEVLEAKLADIADKQEQPAMSAGEILRKINEIYAPINAEMQKYVNNLTLQEIMGLCKLHDIDRLELVHFLAKRKAIPLYKQAGLV